MPRVLQPEPRTSLSRGRTSLSRPNKSDAGAKKNKISKAPPPGVPAPPNPEPPGPEPPAGYGGPSDGGPTGSGPPEEVVADTPGPNTVPCPYLMFGCNRQLILCFSSCAVLLAGAQSRRGCHAQSTGPIRPLVLPFIQVFRV